MGSTKKFVPQKRHIGSRRPSTTLGTPDGPPRNRPPALLFFKITRCDTSFAGLHPPDYEKTSERYPVLYLLHGAGGDDTEWTSFGRAPEIADNLLAQHQAKPMIIVMPRVRASDGLSVKVQQDMVSRGVQPFSEDFINDVIPLIESTYRVKPNRANRAIIGNSGGGAWSIRLGVEHPDLFAWVGSMSGVGQLREVDSRTVELQFWHGKSRHQALPDSTNNFKLLWFSFGKEERGIESGRRFAAALKARNILHQFIEAPGGHGFDNDRPRLCEFLPLLFTE